MQNKYKMYYYGWAITQMLQANIDWTYYIIKLLYLERNL